MKLVELTRKYGNVPYKLGGKSVEEGLDCFGLFLLVGEDLGVKFPKKYENINVSSYSKLWLEDEEKTKKLMVGFLESTTDKIEPHQLMPKDVLLINVRGSDVPLIGLFCGNNLVLTALIDLGIGLYNLEMFRIRGVYRWVT